MSDILYDAKLWLEGRPRHTRTHWQDCHLAHGHTECLVRKLLEEIELLKGYRDNAESDAAIAHLLVDRSRLTDDEQAALQRAIDALYAREDLSPTATADDAMAATRLAGLRDRLKAIKTPRDDRLKAVENQRRADYGKWMRTPYCDGHGCQRNGGGE